MDITKSAAKDALGLATDTALAEIFGITKQALSRIGDDDALPDGRQWELRAKYPHIFGTPEQADAA